MQFGAVIVNYANAPLALDAALSFLGDHGAREGRRAIIVDNASPDDSRYYFQKVAQGSIQHHPVAPEDKNAAVVFADLARSEMAVINAGDPLPKRARLVVVCASDNRGFAAGCNIGLRAFEGDGPADNPAEKIDAYFLLNPDALVSVGALDALAKRLADPKVGVCGASVLDFAPPHHAQALGGARMEGLFHRGVNIGEGEPALLDEKRRVADRERVEAQMSYPLGAAMAVRREYLAHAGYLDERYFLYFEEADWTLAGAPRFAPGWAPEAVVFHRYGGSSKSKRTQAGAPSQRSALSDYHMARSRLLFAMKWRPATAPLVWAATHGQAIIRVVRGRLENGRAILDAAIGRPFSPKI